MSILRCFHCTLKVGCKTLWDKGNEPGVPKCTTAEHYRSKNILLSDVYVPSGIYVFALLFHVTYPSMHFIYFYIHSRNYDNISKSLSKAELREISRLTGCQKPCKYRRYIMVGELETEKGLLSNQKTSHFPCGQYPRALRSKKRS